MIKVSVVVLVNYKITKIKECIASIINQKNIDKEIIIVSNTHTKEDLLKDITDIDVLDKTYFICNKSFENIGQLRNEALKQAKGEFVCFVNSNDFYEEDVLYNLVNEANSSGSEIVISRSYEYNSKTGSYEFKKIHKSLNGSQVINAVENEKILSDVGLYNKLFKTEFLREFNLVFSDTEYYDYYGFVINSLVLANKVSLYPKPFYVERLKNGLDKINDPIVEERIDENQVYDMITVLNDMIKRPYSEKATDMMIKKYISFLTKRGLKYRNISKNVTKMLDKISETLLFIDIEKYNISEKNLVLLTFIKNKKYDEYFNYLKKLKVKSEKKKNFKVYTKYTIFKNIYNFMKNIDIRKRRVLFLSHSPGMDGNFEYIYSEILKYNEGVENKKKFDCKFASTKSNTFSKMLMPIKLARAEFIILCESVPFFQHIDVRGETKVIQSWHAAGAFKKFGFSTSYMKGGPNPFKNKKVNIHCGYDYATVSSKEVIRHYAEAFRLDESKIIPIGLPRADFFFDEEKVKNVKNKIYKLYPKLKDKKVILYAPTFRGFGKKRGTFEMKFDANEIAKNISDEYVIALKLHPSVQSSNIIVDEDAKDKVINISEYKDANDILTITDLLITDYSSIIYDYSLLGKPMIFYAYDLDEYLLDRAFYYDYKEFIPGPLAKTNEEIIDIINKNDFDINKVEEFCETFFVKKDGNNSKRFLEEVLIKL